MASVRQRSESRSRPADATRPNRPAGTTGFLGDALVYGQSRVTRKEAAYGYDHLTVPTASQPKAAPSRIPQNPAVRKLATHTLSSRPALPQESQSWSSTSSGSAQSASNYMVNMQSSESDPRAPKLRNVLRRKQTTIHQARDQVIAPYHTRTDSANTASSSSIPRYHAPVEPSWSPVDGSLTASPVEISIAHDGDLATHGAQPVKIYPELDRYRDVQPFSSRHGQGTDYPHRLATDLPPPTPVFSGGSSHSQISMLSASPSTRFSESPGPGPYSRDTTPTTSISSQSPGLVAPMRLPTRIKQASPADARPPITRRRPGSISNEADVASTTPLGLSMVRENLASSVSSNSTVRGEAKKEKKLRKVSPAPNPPPRKSSQKFKKAPDENESPTKRPKTPKGPSDPAGKNGSPTKQLQIPAASPHTRATPPSRPSRDGAPNLYSQYGGPVPVVHSNLSSSSLSDRRQSGHLAPSSLPRSTTPTVAQDKSNQSKLPVSREPTPAPVSSLSSGTTLKKPESTGPNKAPSPSVSFKSRFAIFGRKNKPSSEAPATGKDKAARKGPAAGTGHEGYGRVGAVKRRSSNAVLPRAAPGSASSSESLASTFSTDPFLLERMNPVIIAGGEVVENRNASSELARTDSNQSVAQSGRIPSSRNDSSASLSSNADTRQTLWPSAFPKATLQSRRPSESSDSDAVVMKPSLALRRSLQRREAPDSAPLNIPKPINTQGIRSPSVASGVTTIFTDDSIPDSRPEFLNPTSDASDQPKKLTKRGKSPRKWGLFGRSQERVDALRIQADDDKAIQLAHPQKERPVAFYTIMDSSDPEEIDPLDARQVARQEAGLGSAHATPVEQQRRPSASSQTRGMVPMAGTDRRPSASSQSREPRDQEYGRQQPALLEVARSTNRLPVPRGASANDPGHPSTEARSRKASTSEDSEKGPGPAGRPSRLPQVGRIPKVVNTRPDHTSPQSFSRPFHRTSLLPAPLQPSQLDSESIAKGPSPPKSLSTTPIPAENDKASRQIQPNPTGPALEGKELFAFAPRKDSECSTSSGSGLITLANHVAVLPEPSAPLGEDEIWDEYNDLLEDAPPSPTSSKGVPFHLEGYETRRIKESARAKAMESPTIQSPAAFSGRDTLQIGKADTASSHYSADMTARINAAFRFAPDAPPTPTFAPNLAPWLVESETNAAQTADTPPAPSNRSSLCSQDSRRSRINSNASRSSEETPLSQVNLRVGSMTVSKWLTFGHVLFSPVRDELVNEDGSLKRQSILVIDGLGNDDWSFYAAETYPAATFFNLSPRAPISPEHSKNSFPHSPSNHHQIQYTSHLDKFPFGPDSFKSVVFRFPSAAPESYYRNIIAEACRVLKPGGYIELSILDADLNNMGNRTRRAVRRLKERAHMQHPEFNLGSTADLVLRLLAKRGFVDVKTCRVGVPVASTLSNTETRDKGKTTERSLAEMMNDETETGDENITKMVSKVGRWWYNRCYESTNGTSRSIWSDQTLLAECSEWGTSLKLMVCHARLPDPKARVTSI